MDANGEIVELRPQTIAVLKILMAANGALVRKDDLMQAVWPDTFVTDDSLVQCISEIRKALGPDDGALLKTVPRQGYRLMATAGAQSRPDRDPGASPPRRRLIRMAAAVVVVLAALALGARFWPDQPDPAAQTITLAVLPFANLSGDAEQDYLSQGLAEDLLTELSRIRSISVISRSSAFTYVHRPDPVAALAADLPVTHVIEGTVRRDGDRLRISVQMVDAQSRVSLWAERYDRELTNLFDLQDEVQARIFSALALRLAPEEIERVKMRGTSSVVAYDLLLKGRQFETALSREGVARAIGFYEQAIAIDPDYAEALARLANMYDFTARFDWSDDPARDAVRALSFAETAVARDPDNPFAHWTLGRILSRRAAEDPASIDRALVALKKAIEIAPNYADAYAFIAVIYAGTDRTPEARAAIDTAFRLNPDGPSWYHQNHGVVAYMEADFEAATMSFEKATALNPTAAFLHSWHAASLAMNGQTDSAEWEMEEALALDGPATISDTLAANAVFTGQIARAAYAEGLRRAGLPE